MQTSRRTLLKALSLLPLTLLLDRPSSRFQGARTRPDDQSRPNILIILFDALSAANMSLYGYPRETTPHLARFAERATVYHRHYAAGNFTSPGTASLLTGTYPWSHRSLHLGAQVAEEYERRSLFWALAGAAYTRIAYTHNRFADVFLNQFRQDLDVYIPPEAFCIFDGRLESRLFPNDPYMADRAFEDLILDQYETPGSLFLSEVDRVGSRVLKEALARGNHDGYPLGPPVTHGKLYYYLEQAIDAISEIVAGARQPFVGYFHLYPPHFPYHTRQEFVGLFEDGWIPVGKKPHFFSAGFSADHLNQLRREYDEFIAYADAEFGRLYDSMAQAGVLDNTYVVVTSDHGELFERGVWEHLTPLLYEPLIHIPLIISKPKQRQRENVYTPTNCVDLLPTLMQVTGQAIPDWCEGEVLPTFKGWSGSGGRSIFAVEAKVNPKHAPFSKGTLALVKDQYKLIHYFGYDGYESLYELYDVVHDPEEMEDLYLSEGAVAIDLRSELEGKLQAVNDSYSR